MKLLNLRKICAGCTILFGVLALIFSVGMFIGSMRDTQTTIATEGNSTTVDATTYYYDQLIRNESELEIKFYKALKSMYENGDLKNGTTSIDLVENDFLTQNDVDTYATNSMTLLYAFGAGKDAFYLDHPEAFYVNFDKMSIRTLNKSGKNYAFLGVGRTESYIADGTAFATTEAVENSITAYDTACEKIVDEAKKQTTTTDKVKVVYDAVRKGISYQTEMSCKDENRSYVRNPYALVTGEGVCEAYARSFKTIMDKMEIPCVSVIGMYNEYTDSTNNELLLSELHMWNYVNIDGVWYLIDTTMDSQASDESCKYFLAGYGTTGASHIPNQVISQSNYSFRYPELCNSQYSIASSLNPNFTMQDVTVDSTTYVKVAYKGKNATQIYEENGLYMVMTNSSNIESGWAFLSKYVGSKLVIDVNEVDDGLLIPAETDYETLRVGVVPASEISSSDITVPFDKLLEYSDVYENQHRVESTHKPFPISVTPKNTEVLRSGVTYNVSLTFDEMLKAKSGESVSVEVKHNAGVTLEDIAVTNVAWDGAKTVTFKFRTSTKYAANTCTYQLYVKGLVSEASGQECMSAGFFVLNQTNVGCPLKWGQTYEIYGKPQLLENTDLNTNDWTLANGTIVSGNFSNSVALVVNDTVKKDTESVINSGISSDLNKNNQTIIASKTYDVSLTLCGQQVKNLPSASGKRVKIMLPFPDGYSGKESGVTFKAYHYNSTKGQVEEVNCLINENGIVIFCDSFSPYTIVATQKTAGDTQKNVVVLAHDGGAVDNEFCSLNKGESKTFNLTLESGFVVDFVRVNGKNISATDNQFSVSYDDLNKDNSVVDVYFVSSAVKEQQSSDGYSVVVPTAAVPKVTITRYVDTLSAVVSGVVGKLSYQWYMDGNLIVGATGSSYLIQAENDNNVYTVEVTNSVMSSTETTLSEPYQKIQNNTVLIVLLMSIVVVLVCVVLATMLIRRKNAKSQNKN